MIGMDPVGEKISFEEIDDLLYMVIEIAGGERTSSEKSSSEGIDEGEE